MRCGAGLQPARRFLIGALAACNGINVYGGTNIRLRNVTVSGSRNFGILVYNSNSVDLESQNPQ